MQYQKNTLIAAPEGIGCSCGAYFRNDFVAFNNLNKADREFDQDIGTEKAIGDMSWMVKR
jgi:hypothetical protein